MKLDERYKFGSCPPYSERRRLVCYIEEASFKCVACGCDTKWILAAQHKAVCSDECLIAMVGQHVLTPAPTPPAPPEPAHHWLLDKETPLKGEIPDPPTG